METANTVESGPPCFLFNDCLLKNASWKEEEEKHK